MSAAIAPEQCLRLLHQIDTDLDEMISLEDMQAYVQRHSLPIGVEEMAAMFRDVLQAPRPVRDGRRVVFAVPGGGGAAGKARFEGFQKVFG